MKASIIITINIGLVNYFYQLINQSYIDSDDDRRFQENILEVSSKEMHVLYESLRENAEKDGLTGTLNRHYFEKKLSERISSSNESLAVCFLDLDHFKQINDTLGHNTGDTLLKFISKQITQLLGENDLFSRIGGDEFVIAFSDLGDKKCFEKKLERLMMLIRQPCSLGKHEITTTASVGVSFFPLDSTSLISLMKKSDMAMYKAKSLGRDNYFYYTSSIDNENEENLFIGQSMPSALINNEFELYLQPILDIRKNKIVGAESLIRWNNPNKGLVFPDRFINLAESIGFITKLGDWSIQEGCFMVKRLNLEDPDFRLTVNVSIRQFQHGDIYSVIKNSLQSSGINPNNFAIEITESIMGDNTEKVIHKINQIKSLGVKIYLDDFGTGFSSLSYLSQLNIDVIKIDKVFVDAVTEPDSKSKLLDTIILMGDALDKHVIAEGVESEYQRQYLLDKGCKYYQGYLCSKPIREKEFVELLNNHKEPKFEADYLL